MDKPTWWEEIDAREQAQIRHAVEYADHHRDAGAPGHGQFILIAKLFRQLEAAQQRAATAQGRTVVQRVVFDQVTNSWRDLVTGVRVDL